jgi:SAM-dependent methyltransferase
MNLRSQSLTPTPEALAYLQVDEYLRTAVEARALAAAFDFRLIDSLLTGSMTSRDLQARLGLDPRSLEMLLKLLTVNGVVRRRGDEVALDDWFRRALQFRELMEAKLAFANLVAADFVDLFDALFFEPQRFFQQARLFRLFDYNRALVSTVENRQATERWMMFTTALTKHESPVCFDVADFRPHRLWMDIGGNSGEFVAQGCARYPDLRATVVDLPVVCEVGREHVRNTAAADRITFQQANALADLLPVGFDLVSFKSMLHDWPEEQAILLLRQAWRCLKPGGTLLIFQRGEIDVHPPGLPYSAIPLLLFFRFFHGPEYYVERLAQVGFAEISVIEFQLDTPFFLVRATRPS